MQISPGWSAVQYLPLWAWSYDSYFYPRNASDSVVSLSVNVGALRPGQDLNALVQDQLTKGLEHDFTNLSHFEASRTTLGGTPAYKATFTADSRASDGSTQIGASLNVMKVWTIKNDTYYRITYVAQPDAYSTYQKAVEQMISSAKFFWRACTFVSDR